MFGAPPRSVRAAARRGVSPTEARRGDAIVIEELRLDPDNVQAYVNGESAELTLPVGTLGSAVLGGFRLRALAEAGLLDEHRAGAVEAADRLLGTDLVPFCTLHF